MGEEVKKIRGDWWINVSPGLQGGLGVVLRAIKEEPFKVQGGFFFKEKRKLGSEYIQGVSDKITLFKIFTVFQVDRKSSSWAQSI